MIDLDILKIESLMGMIEEFKIGNLPLSASGMFPNVDAPGEIISWDILRPERDIDTFEGRHSPAGTRKMQVIGHQSARLATTFKSTFIPGSVLTDLRSPGTMNRQVVATERVATELKALNDLVDRQNEYMKARALQGTLAMTIDGLPHTVDYAIPADHIFTYTDATFPLAWDDPAADILKDIRAMKTKIIEDSGWMPAHVWCSPEVIELLMKNEFIQGYFQTTPAGTEMLRTGALGALFGMQWHEYAATYLDSAGASQRFLPANKIVMTPAPDREWGFMGRGSAVIPTDDKKNMKEVLGRFSYSDITLNPVSAALYLGETRLPVIRIPSVLAIGTTHPV